jgi:hypothetical protein
VLQSIVVALDGGVYVAGVKLLGPYPKPVTVGDAGMPGLASSQSKPSVAPDPVQPAAHETSFSPATLTHLALAHCESVVQRQA